MKLDFPAILSKLENWLFWNRSRQNEHFWFLHLNCIVYHLYCNDLKQNGIKNPKTQFQNTETCFWNAETDFQNAETP